MRCAGLPASPANPAVLWVGHLDDNKDPLTVLDGISAAARELPGLQLWCCFGKRAATGRSAEPHREDSRLRGRVQLLGRVPHETIEQLMQAADLFVLGSHQRRQRLFVDRGARLRTYRRSSPISRLFVCSPAAGRWGAMALRRFAGSARGTGRREI